MKYLASLVFILFSFVSFSQTDTLSLSGSDYRWYSNDTKTWVVDIPTDTVTSADTLFFNLDTLIGEPDTVIVGIDTTITIDSVEFYHDTIFGIDTSVIIFPHKFGNGFSGSATIMTDSILGQIQGDISFALFQADCETCPYYAITGATANHTTPPDDSQKYFQLRGLKLKIVYWRVGTGTSQISGAIILKPSSISNNASN